MKTRSILSGLLILVCGVAFWTVANQRRQLTVLRTEHQRLATASEARQVSGNQTRTVKAQTAGVEAPPLVLLELRAEVTRLRRQKIDLAALQAENNRLQEQWASSRTNPATSLSSRLPAGYVLASRMQWVGLNTPESTIQSFLWARSHHDTNRLLQALSPDRLEKLHEEATRQGVSVASLLGSYYFWDRDWFAGFLIAGKRKLGDGQLQIRAQLAPDVPGGDEYFRLVRTSDGWRVEN